MATRTPEETSKIMSRIRGKDTKIELLLRKELWKRGLRYRKNYKKLPGTPDIVFIKQKIAIFCDSEFWHGKSYFVNKQDVCNRNSEYWNAKICRNIERDIQINKRLEEKGWTVLRFWGKEILDEFEKTINEIQATYIDRS